MKPLFDYTKGLYTLCPHPNMIMPNITSGVIEYHHLGIGEQRDNGPGKGFWVYTTYWMCDLRFPRGDDMEYRYMQSMWTKV